MMEQESTPPRIPIFRQDFPRIILVLVALITAVSLFQFNASPRQEDWLLRAAAILAGPDFVGIPRPFGDYTPLIAHTFLHGGSFHLLLNMVALFSMGPIVALAFGASWRGSFLFVIFFCLCAVGGAVAELGLAAITGQSQIAIGASSAISGLLPAIGYVRQGWRGAWSMSVGWILINIIIAFAGGLLPIPLAWAAHLGGLAAGFSFPVFMLWARNKSAV